MKNPLRQYIYEIGFILYKLGNELCQQANNQGKPINIHSQVKQTMDNLTYYLHNLNADLDKHRRSGIENMADIESINYAVHHLLHSKTADVDSGRELDFTEELRKLEWLCEEIHNTPDILKNSNATYNDFSFDKISGNR